LTDAAVGRQAGIPSRRLEPANRMLRRLYRWTLGLSKHPHALAWLGFISLLESSVFPLAPDILIIPMVLARPRRHWAIAGVATLGSVLGGFIGYGIGHFLFKAIGQPVIDFYGAQGLFDEFRRLYNAWGIWIVAAGGFTPLPYKVVTIASGVTGLDPMAFALASLVSRGSRFFLEAGLIARFGEPMKRFAERNLPVLASVFFLLLLGGFLLFRYVL
jgi:membrane protein YqaA with SNARE-associated domain